MLPVNPEEALLEEDEGLDEDARTDLLSVTSSVYDYEVYHGRTYHSYDAGSYLCPNDKLEQGRLHLQHRALGRLFGDRLHLAPLQTGKTSGRILDVGTGTGEWAICMADAYPSWQVIGTDLSPIQPLFVPPNLAFYIENAREPWVCSEPFDYIHTRATLHAGCWGDFKQEVIEQAFKNLHPGGWLESQEMGCLVQSDDGTLPLDGPLSRWIADVNSASAKIGRPRDVADRMAQWYSEVGFVDVEQKLFKIPVNSWLQGTGLENIGRLWGLNLHEAVEPLSVRLFDVALDRDATATEEMLVDVRKELENPFVHAYTAFYVVYGRKPFPGEATAAAKSASVQPLTPVPDLYRSLSSDGLLGQASDDADDTDETESIESDYPEVTWFSKQRQELVDRIMRALCTYLDSKLTTGTTTTEVITETGEPSNTNTQECTALSTLRTGSGNHNSSSSENTTGLKRSKPDDDGNKDDDDDDEGDGSRWPKKQRMALPDASGLEDQRKFACPYFKRNRRKYSRWTTCPGPGWDEVRRVKDHLYRRHRLPLQCPRCWEVFTTNGSLTSHLQQDPPCLTQSNQSILEGFTPDQEKKLRSRKRAPAGTDEADRWREIYRILFPDDDFTNMPSPYYEDNNSEDTPQQPGGEIGDYAIFLRRELPPLVRREVEQMVQTEFPDVEQRLRPRIERMVISLQARLLSLYQESATAVGAASDQGGQLRQIEASQDHSVQESVDAQDRSPTPVTVSDEQSGLDRAWTQALSPTDFFADFDFDFVENIDIDKLLDPSVVDTERGHLELEF